VPEVPGDADRSAPGDDPAGSGEPTEPTEPTEPSERTGSIEPSEPAAPAGGGRTDETITILETVEGAERIETIETLEIVEDGEVVETVDLIETVSAAPEHAAVDTVDLDARSVVVAVLTVAALAAILAIARSGITTTLIALAGLFAFALDPVVVRIEQRLGLRRGYAVAILVGTTMLVVAVAIAILGPQTVDQARSFQDDLPHVVDDLGSLPIIGSRLTENNVPTHIQEWAAKLPKQLSGDTSQITNAAETVTSVLLDALGVALIMVALLIDGPWMLAGARRLIPPSRRATAHRLGTILGRVIGRYFAGSLLLSVLQGVQVLITGLVLGVPLSPLLAVWAAVWNLVPQVGGAIGGIVFVLVAFTQGATTGVIAGVVFMLYLTFANNVLLPIILGRAVNISPLTTMVATIGGFSVGGVVGAMVAVPLLGAGKAMYIELRRDPALLHVEPAVVPRGVVRKTYARVRRH
jgi:predicted PurR-regulated permease PerM